MSPSLPPRPRNCPSAERPREDALGPSPAPRARWRTRALVALVALLACATLGTPPASAQSRYSTSEARELFVRGSELERRAHERDDDKALLEEAAAVYSEAVARDPALAEAWARLGFVLYLLGRSQEAVEKLEGARARAPKHTDLEHALGINLFAVGRKDEAAQLLTTVVESRRDASDALFLLGVHHLEAGNDAVARDYFERYRELDPADAQAHRALATLALRGRDWPRALEALERLVELEPADVTAHVNLGHVHYAEHRLDLAVASYRRALELEPSRFDVAYDLGSVHVLEGDCAEANRQLDRVLELRPRHFGALYFRADCTLELARAGGSSELLEEADRRFAQIVEARPDYLYGRLKRVEIAIERGDTAQATQSLRELELSRSEQPDVLELGGALLRRLARYDDAIAVHERLVVLRPEVGEYHLALGLDILQSGRADLSLEHLERATDLDPGHAPAWRVLSTALLVRASELADQGTEPALREATTLLERALELDLHPLEARINLAILALRRGDTARATVLLDEARVLDAQSPAVARLEAALLVRERRFEAARTRLGALPAEAMTAAAYNDLAVAQVGLGDWDAAEAALERAAALGGADPHNLALVKLHVGLEHARAGRWRKAEKPLEEAAAHADALSSLDRLRLDLALGMSALEAGRFARAERHLSAVRDGAAQLPRKDRRELAGGDGDLDLDLELAYAMYRNGKLAEAAELLGKRPRGEALRLVRALREALAVDALERGDVAGARQHLELAADGEEASSAARSNLGVVLYRLGDPGRASAIFAKLAEKGLPEAMLNYAVYLEDIASRPQEAITWYERYVSAGGRKKSTVEERLAVKRRIWGGGSR